MKKIGIHNQSKTEVETEAKILSYLTHPHIVTYYDSFIEVNTLYIITEYCEVMTILMYFFPTKHHKRQS
jgi:serine/threonine protein kinase